ncbi:MAG: CpsD/CapB family tyrosine-protein kinase, partial [Phycisphaerae bacterium]|nr:CpsD/CapB family tyrosine-protein kinase [Phycisphaerae bacterium]
GTTTVACATAALLAERVQLDATRGSFDEVLLIDADLHAPTLHKQLAIDPSPGLTDWLADPTSSELPVEATIRLSPVEGLAVMPAGTLRGAGLTPNRLRRLLDAVVPNYRYVVIDLPPLEDSPEAARLAAVCDGAVLVIEAERIRKPVVFEALQTLQEAGVNILGTVLNKRTFPVPEWLYERV